MAANRSTNRSTILRGVLGAVSVLAFAAAPPATAQNGSDREEIEREIVSFDIPAQALDQALVQFSRQSKIPMIASTNMTRGQTSAAVFGDLQPVEALNAILKNTDLEAQRRDGGAYGLVRRVVQVEEIGGAVLDDDEPLALEEIIVTGSNIRGTQLSSSIIVFDRDDIDRTGFGTVEQLLDSLPQQFGGGASVDTPASTDRQSASNRGSGQGINLRGLGSGATLVLLNGRRLAPSGQLGGFVDVSLIPLSAIERVEILTDGASAIYGSDAVGGVVNFITRSDFDGAETRLRYGLVTEGDLDEYRVSQTLGEIWDSGNALLTYEYFNKDSLPAEDKGFSSIGLGADLLPSEERHSLLLSVSQLLSESVSVFADLSYSNRDSDFREVASFQPRLRTSTTEQLNLSLGMTFDVADDWAADVYGNYSRNDLEFDVSINFPTSGVADSELIAFGAKADGSLFETRAGAVRLAVGGGYRNEAFKFENTFLESVHVDADRDIFSAFGELSIPLFGSNNSIPGVESLEIMAAGRFEDYSDFGSTVEPKVGTVWSPIPSLSFRGTYGTSFRAPLLSDLSEASNGATLFPIPDPASLSGTTLSLIAFGGNAGLDAEESTSFTVGADYEPEAVPGLTINVTYFDIEYEGRVDIGFANPFLVFSEPDVFAPVILRDPDEGFVASLVSTAEMNGQFFNVGGPGFTPLDPFTFDLVEAVLDQRLSNLAKTRIRGLEFHVSYEVSSDIGDFDFSLHGDYLIENIQAITKTASEIDFVDTVFNPASLRLRGGAAWAGDEVSAYAFVNYVDGYTNNLTSPQEPVDSFTTVDLQLAYDTGMNVSSLWMSNVRFSLSVLNLFDEAPPFVATNDFIEATPFDPTNANGLGRFIAFEIGKSF